VADPDRDVWRCQECGRVLESWIDRSTQGLYCPACQKWEVVTSYLPPILQDRQIYEIVLARVEQPNADQLCAVARLLSVGYLEARRMLPASPVTVFTGRADDVLRAVASLNDVGLAHMIVPDFVWTAKDASASIAAKGLRLARTDG
jgi:hypothetical protein